VPYTQPTLADAKIALASRLNDQSQVRWTNAQLAVLLTEAIRTWSAWTQHWRDQGSFTVDQPAPDPVPFYDLPTELPALRGQTVTNWDLVTDLQYALLEPVAPGGTWTGSDQFDLDQLSTAIQRRRDQFLRETGAVVTRTVTAMTSPASGRLSLDESVLIVRRAAWRPTASQFLLPLRRTDEWAGNHFMPAWPSSTLAPFAYSTTVTPPITLQMIPPGAGTGSLDLVSINAGAVVDPLVAAPLGVPDDWAWVIKYGALADLLQGDGLALDPGRAAYCEARWQQGLDQCSRASVVLAARLDDTPITVNALTDADQYWPTWQLVANPIEQLLLSGQTLLACAPPPATNLPVVTLDLVVNAPIPANDGAIIQISQDVYDSILDIAQHTALMQEGTGQTELALALLQRAQRAAGVEVTMQQASQPSRRPILNETTQDENVLARQLEATPIP
jgi:hypothetical protein